MRRAAVIAIAALAVVLACGGAEAGEYVVVKSPNGLLEPTPTEAVVYVVRPAFSGKAVKFWAFVDDQPIGVTKGKTYLAVRVPAGAHLFWSRGENVSVLPLVVEAGKVYFIQQHVRMGGLKARVKLERLGDSDGRQALAKCKLAEMTAAGRTRAAEIVTEKYQVAKDKAAATSSGEVDSD